jgi:hypothetical protein
MTPGMSLPQVRNSSARSRCRAISYLDMGTKFPILFDPKTHLPAAIRTLDDDNISGDSNYDLLLSDWKTVGGVKVAHTLIYNLNDLEVAKVTYKEVTADPSIADARSRRPMRSR